MTASTHFWWVRHAPVTAYDGLLYGSQDVDCCCDDTEAFVWLARMLPSEVSVFTSGLKRTHQTLAATVAAGLLAGRVASDPDLDEQCFGAWEGMTYAEIERQYGPREHRLWPSPVSHRPPRNADGRAESFQDLTERTERAIERIAAGGTGEAEQHVVVFAHGGTIRAALGVALGLTGKADPERLETAFRFQIANLSLTRIALKSYQDESGEQMRYWQVGGVNMSGSER